MALGLCGSPGTFQNLLDRLLAGIPPSVGSAFIDDILSPAKSVKEMLANLRVIFSRIRISNLRFNPRKCTLFKTRLRYCGTFLTADGIEADSEKITAVREMREPHSLKDVRRLLGCYSWFRTHIANFSTIAKGLTDCLKQTEQFKVTDEARESIRLLNAALTSPPILIYPSTELELKVFTDASLIGIGGTIGHIIDGTYRPIAYSSKVLNETEQRYPSYKREFYALWYHITKQWRYYLLGAKFTAYVDMKAITAKGFLKRTNEAILTRWIMDLSDYNFELLYRAGEMMEVPDCLSRLPKRSEELFEWWSHKANSELDSDEVTREKNYKNSVCQVDTVVTQGTTGSITPQIGTLSEGSSGLGSYDNPLKACSSDGMEKLQDMDPDIKTVKQWINEGRPNKLDNAQAPSESLLKMWMLFPHMCLSSEGLLCYKYFSTISKKYRQLIFVPRGGREELLKVHHDTDSAGHLGPKKTLLRIREKYFFEGMTKQVKIYCATCPECFKHNDVYKKKPAAPLKPITSVRPGQYLCIDLIGPIRGDNRYKWVLTMCDKFTRLLQAKPLLNAKAETVCKSLVEDWMNIYGVPEMVLSDRGSNLHSAHITVELYKILGIKKVATTSYHPQCNGLAENFNKTIIVIIKKLVGEYPAQWSDKLSHAVFALNSSVNASTRFSPHELFFGRELRAPHDLLYSTTTTTHYASGAHLVSALYENIRDSYELVRLNAASAARRQKLAYDKKKGFHTVYKVGDKVLVWKPLPPTVTQYRKLKSKFSGPWTVERILSEWTYELKNDMTKKVIVTHFDSLRKIPNDLRLSYSPKDSAYVNKPEKPFKKKSGEAADRGPTIVNSENDSDSEDSGNDKPGSLLGFLNTPVAEDDNVDNNEHEETRDMVEARQEVEESSAAESFTTAPHDGEQDEVSEQDESHESDGEEGDDESEDRDQERAPSKYNLRRERKQVQRYGAGQ
eukprot:sb/3461715/